MKKLIALLKSIDALLSRLFDDEAPMTLHPEII